MPSKGELGAGQAAVRPRDGRSLQPLAIDARRLIVRAVNRAGAGHIGGPLSAVDMLVALYFKVMNVDPQQPKGPDRDRFILSKGHASIALYAVQALRGYFPIEELDTFDEIGSRLQGHPDMSVLPSLDMSTGSLGQGLSAGVGMALGAGLLRQSFHTWVMLGDGELQEGQVWEAAQIAARYRLDNLTAIVDDNGLQQYGWSVGGDYRHPARERPMRDPLALWRACGWLVRSVDGHDMTAFIAACRWARSQHGQPTAIVAKTIKGKGVSFMEADFRWHARVPTEPELAAALQEFDGLEAELTSREGLE